MEEENNENNEVLDGDNPWGSDD